MQLSETHALPIKDNTSREIQLLLHEWAVRRCDFEHAEGLMRLLRTNVRSNESSSLAPVRQLQFQEAFMLSQQGECIKAREILRELISSCKNNGMVAEQGRILLQQAVEHLRSAPEYAVNALGPIVECLSVCESLRLDNFVGAVLSILGQAFFCMKEPELSISTIRAALPSLLQCEHVWFQGNAFLTLSKSYLQLAHSPNDSYGSGSGSGVKVRAALKYLKRAEELFASCHDARGLQEVYYLQARLYGSMHNTNARKVASDGFVAVSRCISSGKHSVGNAAQRPFNSESELLSLCSRKLPLRV
jgi:tetratricopeptide (TPR) repeat protein